MNFDYNEEQQLLADSVRRYLQKEYDFEKRKASLEKGLNESVWAAFAEMGLTGLPLSTEPRMGDEPLDYWPKPYERAENAKDAMNEYLAWETDLLPRIARDGTTQFAEP